METVGIRALKQNASAVIARVAKGESIEVTDRGRPVAKIVPLTEHESNADKDPLQDLIDRDIVRPPANPQGWDAFDAGLKKRREELLAQGLPIGNTSGLTMQQILDEQRAERL